MKLKISEVLVGAAIFIVAAVALHISLDHLQVGTATAAEQVPAPEVVQIYAGDSLPDATLNEVPPSLYACRDSEGDGVFMVISGKTAEFMLFDQAGAWVNSGRFVEAKTDEGVDFLHAQINDVHLGFFLDSHDQFHLAIATSETVDDLICK